MGITKKKKISVDTTSKTSKKVKEEVTNGSKKETRKISITRALVELKTISSKIKSTTNEINLYIGAIFKDGFTVLNGKISKGEFEKRYNELVKQLSDLEKTYRVIKLNIAIANTTTLIGFDDGEVTINEALLIKEQLENELEFLDTATKTLASVSNKFKDKEDNNANYVNSLIEKMSGGNRAIKDSESETIKNLFNKFNGVSLVTNVTSTSLFERKNKVDQLINEINLSLVEKNSTTFIEV